MGMPGTMFLGVFNDALMTVGLCLIYVTFIVLVANEMWVPVFLIYHRSYDSHGSSNRCMVLDNCWNEGDAVTDETGMAGGEETGVGDEGESEVGGVGEENDEIW
ncbi:hypothetical protein IFR05_002383 [Cadophora sp. M221]|nr:hypothetical protein IFR05_002383 [Cadophora sp. M221]